MDALFFNTASAYAWIRALPC